MNRRQFLHGFLAAAGSAALLEGRSALGQVHGASGVMVANAVSEITPPEIESCSPTNGSIPPGYWLPPLGLVAGPDPSKYNRPLGHNIGSDEGRLNEYYRSALKNNAPLKNLALAAGQYIAGDTQKAHALGDLAVTGRKALETLYSQSPTDSNVYAELMRNPAPEVARATDTARWEACGRALDRANQAAWEIRRGRIPNSVLGYLAVSGEDDLPYWPVNTPSPGAPQYNISFRVPSYSGGIIPVTTRYTISHSLPGSPQPGWGSLITPGKPPKDHIRTWPEIDVAPVLAPDAEVLLYIHGMDSRAEEASDLIRAFRGLAATRHKNYTVISVDLPNSGYCSPISHTQVAALDVTGKPNGPFGAHTGFSPTGTVPILQFIQDFIIAFVGALDARIPVKSKLRAVMGGSLGGNMGLWLGRRKLPWIRNIICWSPGSIWGHHPGFVMLPPYHNATHGYTPERRREFFQQAFDDNTASFGPLVFIGAQPTTWYRSSWPCIASAIVADRLDRHEMYNDDFRTWHWRLALEQVIYSHQESYGSSYVPYMDDTVTMLLAAGTEDNYMGANICDNTRKVAQHMTRTPGRAMILRNTGHSIHNERPNFFARQIADFLGL